MVIMKKIFLYIVSFTLVFSMMIPFMGQVKAQQSTEGLLELSHKGEKELQLIENQEVEMTLTNKTASEAVIELPEGISYEDEVEGISFNAEENKLTIAENDQAIDFKLNITAKKVAAEGLALQATVKAEDEEIVKSNDFTISILDEDSKKEEVVTEKEEEKATEKEEATTEKKEEKVTTNKKENKAKETTIQKDDVVANEGKKATKSAKVATTKTNQEDLTPEETIGSPWTTKPGVQAAPKPAVITHADPDKANEVDVSTWAEFTAAMTNANINVIHVQDDFYNPNKTANAVFTAITMRNIKVNGNGHVIDFDGTSFRQNTMPANLNVEWEFNHLTIYGRNNYSIITSTGAIPATSSARMIFDNVSYVGSQISANFNWLTDFRGHVESHSVNSYVRPFDGTTQGTVTNEMNLQVKDVQFSKDSYYNGTTENAGVFILLNGGNMLAEENSEVHLSSGGNAGAGEYGYYLMYVLGNSVKLEKNSNVTLNTREKGSMRAIDLGADSTIEADEGAVLNINGRGPSVGYHLIDLGLRAKIHINDSAELNIESKNKGTGLGDLINAAANAEFIIGKKATFNATSDGTGNHNILDFGATSLFKFADAEKVNLQYTNDSISSAAKMFSMTGTANTLDVDVQDIKAWDKSSYSTNAERDPEYHWTPMFGMKTQITTSASKVLEASSVMNSERERYTNEFKPENFSRLMYSYIEDVEVGILNPLTDDITSKDSSAIEGVANPGAYVRLTGDDALPEPTVPSVVDGADEAELTDDFTVLADEKGKFTVHAKEGQTFTAANKIKVFAFLGGKSDEHTVEVLDQTAPTAEGINLKMVHGDKLPNAKDFIINPQDTNPTNSKFNYEFKVDYTDLTEKEGKHTLIIVLSDEAGNKTEIPVELEVTKDGYAVKADNFSISLSDLKAYDTTVKMHELILAEAKATAFGIIDNESVDLTEHLIVEDSSKLSEMKVGVFEITISFDLSATQEGAVAQKKIQVTVLNDEAVKPTNPEKPGKEEPDEVENGGTGQTGLLKLDYAPSAFAFGEIEMGFKNVKTNAVKTTSDKQWLQVSDDRAETDITNWSVQVAQQQQLTSKSGKVLEGAKIQIPAGELYNEQAGEIPVTSGQLTSAKIDITTEPQAIFNADNASKKMQKISTNVWNATDVTLSIPGGQDLDFEEYSNDVVWTLVVEPNE